MDGALLSLIAASVVFVGTHFLLSHPLRAPLVARVGERGFLGLYSLVSLAAFAWMVIAFRRVPPYQPPAWSGYDEVSWTLASLLTILALVLFLGSLKGNPAFPEAHVPDLGSRTPSGVYAVTRHPMMWGFALWAIAHMLVMPTPRVLVLDTAILVLALVGAHFQDRKKAALLGGGWGKWQAQTHYWPRWRNLARAGVALWIGALVAWVLVTWAHVWFADVPAGIWRWVA
ncbi:MAG: MFS transporter [Novosphingobium sp.]|nr:MFS transporter [Novosphingobium sp.]